MKKTRFTTLVSVRIDNYVYEKLKEKCSDCRFENQSGFINIALRFLLAIDNHADFDKIKKFRPEFGDIIDIFSFQYHRIEERR